MGTYEWAWVVIAVVVPLGLFALNRASRGLLGPRLRATLSLLLAVWLLLPAPLPSHPGHYAPAFLVFAFEWLFQEGGNPRPAGFILAAGTLIALALLLVVLVMRRGRGGSVA
jgi:hypothetical protein